MNAKTYHKRMKEEYEPMGMRQLRWVALSLALIGVAAVEFVRAVLLPHVLPDQAEVVGTGLMLGGTIVFSLAMFRTLETLRSRELTQSRENEALRDLSARLSSNLDLTNTLHLVIERAMEIIEADCVAIYLFQHTTGQMVCAATTNDIPPYVREGDPLWHTDLGRLAMKTGDVVAADNPSGAFPEAPPANKEARSYRMVRFAPLITQGHPVGLLALYDKHSPVVTGEERELMRAFASHAAQAVGNALTFASQQRIATQLQALDDSSLAIAAAATGSEMLQKIVDIARSMAGARYGALSILRDDGSVTQFWTSGLSAEEREAVGPPPRGRGLLGHIFHDNKPIRVANISADPRSVGFPPNHPLMRSFLGVPVIFQGMALGNLYLTDKMGEPEFTEDDERIMGMLARHAAVAVNTLRLRRQTENMAVYDERDRISKDLHDGIIQSVYAVGLQLDEAIDLLGDQTPEVREIMNGAIENLNEVIHDLRNYIMGLGSQLGPDRDLGEWINRLVRHFKSDTLLDCTVTVDPNAIKAVTPEIREQIVHVARESLANISKHAAASRVRLDIMLRKDNVLRMEVEDNGRGMNVETAPRPESHGLQNMRSRGQALGGRLEIVSAPGKGTHLIMEVPLSPPTNGSIPIPAGREPVTLPKGAQDT